MRRRLLASQLSGRSAKVTQEIKIKLWPLKMLDTRITAVVALPMVHVFSTQTVAEFYPRRTKPNLDKSGFN
jgi:hypothetical protein